MHRLKTITLTLLLVIFSIAVPLVPILSSVANAGENAKYRLTVNPTPSDSRIRIMNIKPKYRHGIALKPGRYDIEVTRSGYELKRGWVEIKNADLSIDVILNKLGAKEQQVNEVISSEADDAALIQYALQLRKTKPELFSGAQGILVLKIEPNSPAEKKGLRRGDIVVAYNGQQINSGEELVSTVQANATKSQVNLQFIRANVVQTIVLKGGYIGVRLIDITEEMSVEQFENEFIMALQSQNYKKIEELFINNPNTAEQYQHLLTRVGEGEGKQAEQARALLAAVGEMRQALASWQSFVKEFFVALQAEDYEKIRQLFINNPETAKQFQQVLARAGKDELAGLVGEVRQDLSNGNFNPTLDRLLGEGEKAYYAADYPTALKKWQIGLEKAREIGGKLYINRFLTNIGNVYDNLGQYQTALDYFQQALPIHREINNRRGEWKALNNIGVVYNNLGQYQTALDYFQQALTIIHRETKNRRGEGGELTTNIGVVYKNLGQYQTALDYFQQALTIYREIKDRRGEGGELTNIGVVYKNLGQYQTALDYYQQALTIHREIKDRRREGADFGNIGAVYNISGQYQTALDYYQQALTIHREIKERSGEGIILYNIGLVYKSLGKYQQAKKAFQDSQAINIAIGSGETWISQRGLASIEAKLNQFDVAIQHYEQALDNIERLRAGLEKEHKISFMRDKLYVYDEFIALLQSLHPNHPKKGYDRKAIETFERKQGRVFLEEMGQSGARRFVGLNNEIIVQEQSLMLKWKKLKEKSFTPQERATLEQAEARLKKRIKTEHPKYYTLKYPQPVDLATLQNQVLQKGEMMLVYGVLSGDEYIESQSILWIIGKHQFQMLTLNISEDELQDKVDAFRASPNTFIEAIKTEPSWAISDLAEDNLPSLRQASYDLYQLLMPEKARTLLKDARTLYIVPTGPLYGLPFGALDTHAQHDTPHYLIQDYPIAYLSSASLLKTIRDTKRDETSKRYPFLAFADPQYPKNCSSTSDDATQVIQSLRTQSYLKLAGSENKACFTELPETKVQAETIAKLLNAPKRSNALQLRAKASRQNVFDFSDKKRLKDYQYVLFAAHAVLPYEITRIKQSAIVLSNPDTEGYLTMADAFALDMNADLVMLSACNTGRGEKIKGEGIRGLTRAFMYAGTPAVSVSLWSVESRSAKRLSISLFKYLQDGKPLAQALRQSKLDLMADEDFEMYQHPYFWAPFVVFGDGN